MQNNIEKIMDKAWFTITGLVINHGLLSIIALGVFAIVLLIVKHQLNKKMTEHVFKLLKNKKLKFFSIKDIKIEFQDEKSLP